MRHRRESPSVDVTRRISPVVARTLDIPHSDAANVAGAFPDGHSALMLVSARLRHIAGMRWGSRCYLDMERLREPVKDETLIATA